MQQPSLSAYTSGTGAYTLAGLPAGSYKIGFTDYATGQSQNIVYGDNFWNGAPTLGSATPITVTAGQAVVSTNAVLTKQSALATLTATPTPTVSGVATVGHVLTGAAGTWAPATVILTYQWQRDLVPIDNATALTYTVTAADVGHHLTLVVTGHKFGYKVVPKTSLQTALVS